MNQTCCGGQVYEGHVICCGDHVTGSAYEVQQGMMCCGQNYVIEDRSLCCTSDTGHQQVKNDVQLEVFALCILTFHITAAKLHIHCNSQMIQGRILVFSNIAQYQDFGAV